MGQLYSFRLQQFAATGVPIPSARLYTFDPVATTTPKATYSDNDLTVSNGAYVQADAAGVFPQIFAANGEAFYASLRTAAGVEVQQFQFLTALGSDDATSLLRDFTTNGRFQVRGADGIVQIETGDPAGDDVGGDARMGGWDGTQGTTLELDYADVSTTGDFDVAGALTADTLTVGSGSNLPTKLSSGTVTAAASVEIPLPSTYDAYIIRLAKFSNTNSAALGADLSFAASYKTASGDYTTCLNHAVAGTYSATTGISSAIPLSTSGVSLYGNAVLNLFSTAGQESVIDGQVSLMRAAGAGMTGWPTASTNAKSYGKADKIRLSIGAGTMTCEWALFGVPGL